MATKKRILISSGPTWIAIDKARVISNIASGETGFILARKFIKAGFQPTLLLGPGYFCPASKKLKIIRFKYFHQLEALLKNELKKGRYSAVIHAAAVSDYRPEKSIKAKISSNKSGWKLNLVPTKKLIDGFRNIENLITVGFKFEPELSGKRLIGAGKKLLKNASLDLVVANSSIRDKYCAYIIDDTNSGRPLLSKSKMASRLVNLVKEKLK
ncbi:MAG: phosphopantothenoylcysteine decarboxylase [Candidatus Omnitrophota bacterium]